MQVNASARSISSTFGVIVVSTARDYRYAKATCASIRHFCGPDVPICILADGNFRMTALQRTYGVRVLRRRGVRDARLRTRTRGMLFKEVALFAGPFETFMLVDADTVFWGDLRKRLDFTRADVIVDVPHSPYTFQQMNDWFFDTAAMAKHFPKFKWEGRPFVCAGVYAARRGAIPADEFLRLIEFMSAHPDVLKIEDQGLFNYMMFNAGDEGRVRLVSSPIQTTCHDFSTDELRRRFPFDNGSPPADVQQPTVIHYNGPRKPHAFRNDAYAAPMLYFRLKFLRDAWGIEGSLASLILWLEDWKWEKWMPRWRNYANRFRPPFWKRVWGHIRG